LHAAIAGNEVALGVTLATGNADCHERSQSRPRCFCAVQSRCVRALLQENDLKRLRDAAPQTRRVRPEIGLSQGVQ
jgi:hypothetical protein